MQREHPSQNAREAAPRDETGQRRSLPLLPRVQSEESWVEVASQPSSSSLSSIADEIITTGLRVQNDANRRRRRVRPSQEQPIPGPLHDTKPPSGTSSQEEYEESDSDPDRGLTSSGEGLQHSPMPQEWPPASQQPFSNASSGNISANEADDDESDENSTAINVPRGDPSALFTPQPNAFTHPPSSYANPTSYFPPPASRPAARPMGQRHSYPSHYSQQPRAYSPGHQDHDEALRASLSTLLSCAAAARNLPKNVASTGSSSVAAQHSSIRVQPSTLRMVTEEEALGLPPPVANLPITSLSPPMAPQVQPPRSSSVDKHKRKKNGQRSSSKDRKKQRSGSVPMVVSVDDISPTLLTWVVSAGVVVLVSAISFSAGYVVGREAGKTETEAASAFVKPSSCASEVGKGLRRFRWSGAATSVRA